MEIDLTDEPDIDIEPGVADTPVPARGYKLFDMEELDVDYLEVTGPCVVLPYMNKGTFNLGTTVRNHGNMLLVAQGPGYVDVEKDFKNPIIVQLSLHFGITMEPSDDDRGLLKWMHRRLCGWDLAEATSATRDHRHLVPLIAAGVRSVTYVDYAMKGKLVGFSWIDELLTTFPETRIVVDVATMTRPSIENRVQLVRWRRSRPEGCKGVTHELYGAMQKPPYYGSVSAKRTRHDVVDPTMLKCMVYSRADHIFKSTLKPGRLDQPRKVKFLRLAKQYFGKLKAAFTEQRAIMGDMRTEIRFEVRSFGEIPMKFSRQFAKIWALVGVLEIDVDQVLKLQEASLEWAQDNRLFVGRDTDRVSRSQYATFNILLNTFGVWNRFTRWALRPSNLMETLRAKLIVTGVRLPNVIFIDEDEEMKDDGSETESEIDEQDVIVVEDSDTEFED